MKKFLLSFCILLSSFSHGQDLVWPEALDSINTGVNLTVLLDLSDEISLNTTQVNEGALLGVFYLNELEEFQCGGFVNYTPGEIMAFPSYGDDSTTDEKDGFNTGESFVWYMQIAGIDYPMIADYIVGGLFIDVYQTNMMARITSLTIEGSSEEIEGCTDNTYLEFSIAATFNDGSCLTLIELGCMDDIANNYDPEANQDDGTCIIYGCTDSTAINYNVFATTDDGTCIEVVLGCADPLYLEYNPESNTQDDSCLTLIIEGCTNPTAFNYNELANTDDGTCLEEFLGCIDLAYLEYNPEANTDDGSCLTLIIEGCTDSLYLEFNIEANQDNGSCTTLILIGCMDENHCNFNDEANVNDEEYCYLVNVTLVYDYETPLTATTDTNVPTYTWYFNNIELAITENQFDPTENGFYEVVVTDDLGCNGSDSLSISTVSLTELLESTVSIFPNPVADVLNISLENVFENISLQILNTIGTVVLTTEIDNYRPGNSLQLQVFGLSKGMYLLRINTGTQIQTLPWLKQ